MEVDRIIGDFNDIGWVVVRGVQVNSREDDDISTVAKICARGGIWFSLEIKANNHQMKYTDKQAPR